MKVSIVENANEVLLTFASDGPFFPERLLNGEAGGMGLYLVETLVQHDLGGTFSLRNDSGPTIVMRLPRGA